MNPGAPPAIGRQPIVPVRDRATRLPCPAASAARYAAPPRRACRRAHPSRWPEALRWAATMQARGGPGPTRKLPARPWPPRRFRQIPNGPDRLRQVGFRKQLLLDQAGSCEWGLFHSLWSWLGYSDSEPRPRAVKRSSVPSSGVNVSKSPMGHRHFTERVCHRSPVAPAREFESERFLQGKIEFIAGQTGQMFETGDRILHGVPGTNFKRQAWNRLV